VLAVLGLGADAQSLFDYISFDGVDYVRWAEEPGRPLERGDLGPEFGVVACSFGEDSRSCPYGIDAGAAYMPAGTRIHAVRGYATEFRLAAVWKERIFLYQAWRNPRARVGGNLFDLRGKVRAIEVQRNEPSAAAPATAATIGGPAEVEALVDLLVRAAVRRPSPHGTGEPRYWLTFWLTDGTTLGRPYFPESGELLGGVVLPPEFRVLVERHLRN
jgi:hypothetical protein